MQFGIFVQNTIGRLPLLLYYGTEGAMRRKYARNYRAVHFGLPEKEKEKKFSGTSFRFKEIDIVPESLIREKQRKLTLREFELAKEKAATGDLQRRAKLADSRASHLEVLKGRSSEIGEELEMVLNWMQAAGIVTAEEIDAAKKGVPAKKVDGVKTNKNPPLHIVQGKSVAHLRGALTPSRRNPPGPRKSGGTTPF